MEIPPGFEESMAKNQVCKLQKSLYGLKQSPRAWFDRFTKAVLKLGYKQGQADHTLFVKKSHAGKLAILIVYVDDIILSGNDMGMARSRKGIVVSQRKYILDLLKETGMLGCKPIDTPMDSQKKLGIEKESTPVDRGRYQRLVGRLIYLSHTRPDIGFAVSAVSQFMHSPTEEHMEAVYRILRYLKMTPGKGLFFRKTENRDTEVYSDADWAGNIIDRRSTSGYCSFVWGNLVTWRSKKQSVVARSSAEAEYRALAQGICEGIWIKRVLSELGQTSSSPILMMCDNQAAISIAKNPVHHDRTKHVEIDRHFITEKVHVVKPDIALAVLEASNSGIRMLDRASYQRINPVVKLGIVLVALKVFIPGSRIPDWISFVTCGHFSCLFTLKADVLFDWTSRDDSSSVDIIIVEMISFKRRLESDHVCLCYVPLPQLRNCSQVTHIKVSFMAVSREGEIEIKRCGVGIVYSNEDGNHNNPPMIRFNSISSPPPPPPRSKSTVVLEEIHEEEPSGNGCSNVDGSEEVRRRNLELLLSALRIALNQIFGHRNA
ncbi:Retrovirus-related Pol polyprotein from transposon RE1 [Vitis vinifera]|uniref:Retrovirus-related Pol polyprotein from transposon RE1 n=1 Tax=Vitis vinifera TaxID=29760 RepID=A0A438HP94_VITVI|nr:Retrovirus-related Pol polyprotein from transposon RE1 [Vitis vinifera]